MSDIYIFGASGHGSVVLDAALSAGIQIKGFVDHNQKITLFENLPVKKELSPSDSYIIAIGDNAIRQRIASQYNNKVTTSIKHLTAIVNRNVTIGDGSVICSGAIINPNAVIGNHCIINTSSIIEHDCVIEDFVHISPNVTLCGNVKIGKGTHVGAGATVIPGITIGEGVTIGAGSVIIKDIPSNVTAVGNPGKIIKT
jgi:acetyltransferase EpsM